MARRIALGALGAAPLRVSGLTRMTSIDFPGQLAAVVFCQGCPWRCGYCHNPDLLDATAPAAMAWGEVLAFLRQRQGLLDAVVFSGGEPLLQPGLPAALQEVRALGFATGLHTGGMYPERLAAVLPHLDWVGLDIKAPEGDYARITATPGSGAKAFAGLQCLLASGVDFECRTTWHPGLFPFADLLALGRSLQAQGVRQWAVQQCRTPDAAAWCWTADQQEALAQGWHGFTLRTA